MKKSQPNSQDELNILTKIKINPQYSQRKLAYDLGLSLGKLNYCLKGLQQKGLIKIQNFSKQKNKVKLGLLVYFAAENDLHQILFF